jgi:integrase/recombinase XerD
MQLHEFFPGLLNFKREEGAAPKTIQEYKRIIEKILVPSIGHIELESLREIDTGKIKMAGREHGVFGEQRGIVVFRQLLLYIKKAGFQVPFDWRDLKVPSGPKKEVDWLTPEEWEQVRKAFDLSWIVGLRDRALVEVLWATGLRISEALSLNRDSINWETKEVSIRNCKPPHEVEKV